MESNAAVSKINRQTNIQHFQSLEAGQYWRALVNIEKEEINVDMVLLIESLKYLDDQIHTVVLRTHPSLWVKHEKNQHCFLLNDFLIKFEYEFDADSIREREIQDIQKRVTALQTNLIETQSNPEKFKQIVAEKLSENTIVNEPSTSIVPTTYSSELSLDSVLTGLDQAKLDEFQVIVNREAKSAEIQANWIQEKVQEISSTINSLMPYYTEKAAAALAKTEDTQNYIKKLTSGIKTLELYVGTDVEVETIKTGKSADPSVKLAIMQQKLYMDLELSVWADIDTSFDYTKQELFIEALKENQSLVNQIFSTERCIVAMATTQHDREYSNPWESVHKNQNNRAVFLLVRDGENLYRIYSSVESHLGADRLFPATNESKNKFRGLDGSTITVNDIRYTDHHKNYERMALHYKRFLILICGLDHRLNLFGKFYSEPQSPKFVSQEFQDEHFLFIHDDDGENMLPSENRISFDDWIEEKNSYLRSGSRIICNWKVLLTSKTAPGAFRHDSWKNSDGPMRSAFPINYFDVAIAFRDGENLFVNCPVESESYQFKSRKFNCKVQLSNMKSEWYSLPFLVLDTINPDDLHWYIHDRSNRKEGFIR